MTFAGRVSWNWTRSALKAVNPGPKLSATPRVICAIAWAFWADAVAVAHVTKMERIVAALISAPPPRAPIVTVYTKADLAGPRPDTLAVSAKTGAGIDAMLAVLRDRLPEGPFHYNPDELATQPMRFFAAEFVREAAFELLHEELPYSVACEIDEFREGAEPVYIRAVLYVERDSQKGIVIGEGGRTIKALGAAARAKIETLLDQRVFLDLHVKVLPKWRRDEPSLKRLGYATS